MSELKKFMKKFLPRSSPKAMVRGFTVHDLRKNVRSREKLISETPKI